MMATSVRIAAIVGVVLIVERLLRRGDAQSRYRLLVATIASLFLPPVFAASWFQRAAVATEAVAPRGVPLLSTIYVAGVLVWAFRYLLELRAVARMRRRCSVILKRSEGSLPAPAFASSRSFGACAPLDDVLISPDDVGPLATGFVHPVIVLPRRALETLTDDELQIVIAHERTHIARRHLVVAHVARIAQIVWWFNPFVALLARAERRVREEVCDELVVTRTGVSRDAYCATLLRATAAGLGAPLLLAAAFARHPLASRMRRIMNGPRGGRAPALITFAMTIAIVVTQLGAAPPRSTPDPSPEEQRLIDAVDNFSDDSPSPSVSPSPSPSP
jgi:beta-lactamase regulating signal transducer with metallopeptidase domain